MTPTDLLARRDASAPASNESDASVPDASGPGASAPDEVSRAAASALGRLPLQETSLDIWDKKYRLKTKDGRPVDASVHETFSRVARALADVETTDEARKHWYGRFLWALAQGAVPAGRITSNAGALEHKPATSTINCTVSGTIVDSMDDILGKVHEAGLTLKAGCVAPGTTVVTERGHVPVERAVAERHESILSYDRKAGRFEMRRIEKHMTTHVAREDNIEIRSNGARLLTSCRHPVLVYRDGRTQWVRADEVVETDAMVHRTLPWRADEAKANAAWFAGAHLGDGCAYEKKFDYASAQGAWQAKAKAAGKRLVFEIRAAEREVVERYAAFFQDAFGSRAQAVAASTVSGTAVWDFTVASFAASDAAEPIDHQIGEKSATIRVPEWVLREPDRFFLPFLAGLLDTDGTVSKERGAASLVTQSERLADETKSTLALFGVDAGITKRKARSHEPNGHAVHDSGGYMVKISDSDFLRRVAGFMADSGKTRRIREFASTAGQYDQYAMPEPLKLALEALVETVDHRERQTLGFYHGYHRRDRISRVWLDRWRARFPQLGEAIDFCRTLRPVESVRGGLDLPTEFFDFTVEGNNNYLAGIDGLVVTHNCGIGYDFSTLRPRGAYVSGAGAYTSGPLSFMDIFDKMCFTVSSAGGRRGAQMGTFDVRHPDVLEYIKAKREDGRLRQFNLSLLITEDFIQAVKADEPWQLAFPVRQRELEEDSISLDDPDQIVWYDWPSHENVVTNDEGLVACRIYRTLPARRLWDLIMASTYDFAEPGFILIDKMNEQNNNWFDETIRATNPCVTGDTRLATQFGMVPIVELYASREELDVTVDKRTLGGDERGATVRPAKPAFMTADRAPVYRVTTADGYEIKATEWHDFYTQRGKIRLHEMRVGDELLVQSGKGQFGDQGSEDLGMLLGLIAGDGHFTNRGKGKEAAVVSLWGDDMALANRVTTYVNTLIAGASLHTHREYTVSPVAVPARNMVFIRSVMLARLLEHYGFTKKTKHSVPEVVWRGSEECVRGYLQALFQADGTVNATPACCSARLASSELPLLKDVQTLLANFGVFCSVKKRRKAGSRNLPDGRGGTKSYRCKADYELIISGESREQFMREVGFLLPEKNEKYEAWTEGKALKQTQRFQSKIVGIDYVGEEAVYDTTQPDHNSLVFNGLVTGNCGEQGLPPYGACLLGSINLTRFVLDPFTDSARFDWDRFRDTVAIFTRMLDNVVEINGLPLKQQQREIRRKRRHGMGYLGLGSTLTLMGMKYGDAASLEFTDEVTRELAVTGWKTGLELAKEKSPAPIMDETFTVTGSMLRLRPEMKRDGYSVGDKVPGRVLHAKYSRYMQKVAEVAPELVAELAEHGCRFTHHSSIAPTGTIALSLGNNASNGIEPSFAHHYARNVIREGKKSKEKVDVFSFELLAYQSLVNPKAMPYSDDPDARLPDYFIAADDISPADHVSVQAAAQTWIDSSISKTANVPTDYAFDDFKDIYLLAHEKGLKGCTTFRFNPEAFQGVLVKESDLENTTYDFTLEDGSTVSVRGNEEIEYDGETHTAANLYDALKEGYYGKF